MKSPNTLTAALAAFAGLSFAVAYAAPSYTPDPNSPINTTPLLNSASTLLNNYDDEISVIDSFLAGTDSLVQPTVSPATFPKATAYVAAVAAAVAAHPTDTQKIVEAAVQYRPGNYGDQVKNILKAIATATPASAEDAVIGATAGNPLKAADAAAGAILGIIASPQVSLADYGDIVDDTVQLSTQTLIEKIGKAAVSSTKKAPVTTPTEAVKVAKAIVAAVIADGSTLYIDVLARGLVAGAAGISGTSQAEVAAATLDALHSTALENPTDIAETVAGALKALKLPDTTGAYAHVLAALKASTVGSVPANTAIIDAVDAANLALRNAPATTEKTALQTALTPAFASNLEAFIIGAVENKPAKSSILVDALLTDPDAGTISDAVKEAVVGGAVRGKFSNAGKVVTAAIVATSNSLSPTLAVAAAIPNATSDFAGVITGAAVKAGATTASSLATSDPHQADDIANAALSAAVSAGYADAINDIALQAIKNKKAPTPAAKVTEEVVIVQALIGNPASAGWREAIVAQAVIYDKKTAGLGLFKTAADAGAVTAGASAFERVSIGLAADIALDAKLNPKTLFDDAVEDFYGPSIMVGGTPTPENQFAKAIIFGRGEVSTKLAGPLLALAMKYNGNSSLTNAQLLAVAKSVYKKAAPSLDIQYNVIQDALNSPDQLFDEVDHEISTHLAKYAVDIAAAAAAARPEYAHIVARAGAKASPTNAGKIGAAAITYDHMTNNRNTAGGAAATPDDPAAVAAISAATILGIKDAKLPTAPTDKEATAVKNAAGALVKAASLLHGTVTTFRQSDGGVGTFKLTSTVSEGSAGAVTGIIAELQGYGSTLASDASTLSHLASIAITAAIKADKKHSIEIAQAAAQAAQFVYQLDGGAGAINFEAAIALLVTTANSAVSPVSIANAVHFGVTEAQANTYGAGAAGILNYAHRSGILPAVTSLENF